MPPLRIAPSCLVLALLAVQSAGQCVTGFGAGTGVPGVVAVYPGEARVRATMVWDPDGAGPAAPGLVVADAFYVAGNCLANNIAFRDASGNWSPLGSGLNPTVLCLATLPTGELVAGGSYGIAGGNTYL